MFSINQLINLQKNTRSQFESCGWKNVLGREDPLKVTSQFSVEINHRQR